MNVLPHQSPKQLPFGLLLVMSFGIFNLGYIVDQTIRWTNHFHGFTNGLLHVVILAIAWSLLLLPWSLLIFALYRWRKWNRFRTLWVLTPALLTLLASIGALIADPPTASNRFKGLAKSELPKVIQNLHYNLKGGGIADYSDTYYFETSPQEIARLIAEMHLREDKYILDPPVSVLPGCPDYSSWQERTLFRNDDHRLTYYLVTDTTKTKVYVAISSI